MNLEKKKVILNGEEFDYYIYSDGQCQNIKTNRYLKGTIDKTGYKRYYLRKDNIVKNIAAHILVASMFLENPDNLPVVHHIDSNKLNNDVSNLKWVSYSENALEIKDQSHKKKSRPAYEYYEGDLDGEVWAFYHDTHLKFSNYGRLLNTQTNRILKMHVGSGGYCYYSPKLDGKTKKILCHRGVYEAFNNVYLTREQQIDHIDSNKSNNHLDNLRVVSAKENSQFRSDKIVEQKDYVIGQYDLNNNLIKIYACQEYAAKELGISSRSISSVLHGVNKTAHGFIWKKIPKQEVQRLSVMNVAE